MAGLIQQLFLGLSLGLIFVMLALGLNIVLGLMGVVNFVHGALFMMGAYMAVYFSPKVGFWPAVLIGALVVGLLGVVLEVPMIRRVYGRIPEYGLLLTFGLAGVFEQIVRIIWGDFPAAFPPPRGLDGTVDLGFTTFPAYRLASMVVIVLVVAGVWLFLTRTPYGMIIRAGIQDRLMVGVLGINLPMTFTMVYGFGAALGALAGALSAPIYGIYPSMGGDFVIYAFVVVIVGGIGSFWGAVVGGLVIGIVQALVVLVWAPGQQLSSFIVLALVLLLRPRGIMGMEGLLE